MKRFIPTRTHGFIDLATPPALLAVPAMLRLERTSPAALAPRILGGGAAAYSMLTDYETSPKRMLPVRLHLVLDAISGAMLAAAPWVSGDARRGARYWVPHVAVGSTEIALAMLTRTQPADRRGRLKRWARRNA